MIRHAAILLATTLLLAPSVLAQDGDNTRPLAGIAVSQAPEAGLGVCFGPDAESAIACAQRECMETSGLGEEDCAVNLWCYPHGWTAQIAVMHVEGPHWSKFLCGMGSREEVDRAVALFCDQDYFAECLPVRIWDWAGNLVLDYE